MRPEKEIQARLSVLMNTGAVSKASENILFAKIDTVKWILDGDTAAKKIKDNILCSGRLRNLSNTELEEIFKIIAENI